MQPKQLGDENASGEATSYRSGRRVVCIKRRKRDDLTSSPGNYMGKVIGYVHHHIAQRLDGDDADSDCRYSFEDWSYDPDDTV